MNAIYCLRDKNREIRYIGKTLKAIKRRLQGHMAEAKGPHHNHRLAWIRSLGRAPIIEVMEWTSRENAAEREIYWIAWARSMGCDLVNGTDGGEGAINPSQETLKKRRRKMIGALNPNFGKSLPEEHKQILRDCRLGKPLSEETKLKQRLATRSNNTSGVPGVRRTAAGKFRLSIMWSGKRVAIGTFDTIEEASTARSDALFLEERKVGYF